MSSWAGFWIAAALVLLGSFAFTDGTIPRSESSCSQSDTSPYPAFKIEPTTTITAKP